MTFLVPHSSHLSQPLDLCIFGLVKNIIRNEATYAINVKELAKDDSDGRGHDTQTADQQEPRRAERGKALAESIAVILDAFERATSRRRVVSAFSQAGVFYELVDPHNLEGLVTKVDPASARAVIEGTGLFADLRKIPEPPAQQIKLSGWNSDLQTTWTSGRSASAADHVRISNHSQTQTESAPTTPSQIIQPTTPAVRTLPAANTTANNASASSSQSALHPTSPATPARPASITIIRTPDLPPRKACCARQPPCRSIHLPRTRPPTPHRHCPRKALGTRRTLPPPPGLRRTRPPATPGMHPKACGQRAPHELLSVSRFLFPVTVVN